MEKKSNITTIIHSTTGVFENPEYLSYSVVKRAEEAARKYAEMFPDSDYRSHIRLDFTTYAPFTNDEFEITVYQRDVFWKFKYLGDISFARNYKEKNDCIYEVRDVVCKPKPNDPDNVELHIYGTFKNLTSAMNDLFTKGTWTTTRRRAMRVIR